MILSGADLLHYSSESVAEHSVQFGMREDFERFKLSILIGKVKVLRELGKKVNAHQPTGNYKPSATLRLFAIDGKALESDKALYDSFEAQVTLVETFIAEWRETVREASKFANSPTDKRLDFDRLWAKTEAKWQPFGDRAWVWREFNVNRDYSPRRAAQIGKASKVKLTTPTEFPVDLAYNKHVSLYMRALGIIEQLDEMEQDGGGVVQSLFAAFSANANNMAVRVALDDRFINLFNPYVSLTKWFYQQVRGYGSTLVKF